MRRSCAAWGRDGAATLAGAGACRYVGSLAGGAAAVCECDGLGVDFGVLSEDLTRRIPQRGCLDPAATTYDPLADAPYAAACAYASPPPPPLTDGLIAFSFGLLNLASLLLGLLLAALAALLRHHRLLVGVRPSHVTLPATLPSAPPLPRAALLVRLAQRHAYMAVVFPADHLLGTAATLGVLQCLTVLLAPLHAALAVSALQLLQMQWQGQDQDRSGDADGDGDGDDYIKQACSDSLA